MTRQKLRMIFISGLFFVSVLLVVAGLFTLGLVPVNADATPSFLERKLLPMIVRASVSRNASKQSATPEPSEASTEDDSGEQSVDASNDDAGGEEIYREMCAQCHGRLDGRASVLGASFYPPAPQLFGRGS